VSPPKHAVITAAGLGSRLGMNIPKCLVPVAGKSIIDRQLELLQDIEDVRIVVGFQRAEVIAHVRRIRSDVIYVCNHGYANTSVLQSLFLGCQGIDEPFLVLDGDVIPDAFSFRDFLGRFSKGEPLTAICKANSTDPVYATVDPIGADGATTLRSLQREPGSEWEWPGVSIMKPSMVEYRATFVYQQVQQFLPMPAYELRCWEIDTPQDLVRAERAFRRD